MRVRLLLGALVFSLLIACGDNPLQSLGERSSGWINEPEVTTTTLPPTTVPRFVDVSTLRWSNDDIVTENLSDPEGLVAEIFARREGDRFIQASREEIATALPMVRFPAQVPHGAEWVSSQLVIENTGLVSDSPSAAFGIWSDEPYSRSRSVAQMAIFTVATDAETAAEVADPETEITCGRFSSRSTNQCEVYEIAGHPVWELASSDGTTLIWFDESYRYELFGRRFVERDLLVGMASETVSLADVEPSES